MTGCLMAPAVPWANERPTIDKLTAAAITTARMSAAPPHMRLVVPVVVCGHLLRAQTNSRVRFVDHETEALGQKTHNLIRVARCERATHVELQ